MASSEDREKHSRRRKKNVFAKILHDQNEFKGAFSLRVLKDKTNYKRSKIIDVNQFFDENDYND